MQGDTVSFSSIGAGGRLLQSDRDPLVTPSVSGHKVSQLQQWQSSTAGVINLKTQFSLPWKVQELHLMSVEELREVQRGVMRHDRVMAQKV